MGFFLKCSETAEVCDKHQYKEAKPYDHFKMKLHLLLCRFCRNYSSNNKKLTKSIGTADIKNLSGQKKQDMREKINRELMN